MSLNVLIFLPLLAVLAPILAAVIGRVVRIPLVVFEIALGIVFGPALLGWLIPTPLTERMSDYSAVLPDKITIFRNAICSICSTEQDVVNEVRATVVHEVGHHFGIDDERLHELGW